MQESQFFEPIIVGCGFLGKYLAKLLVRAEQHPLCIVKSESSQSSLFSNGYQALTADLDDHLLGKNLPALAGSQIYYLAPPSNNDAEDHRIDNFLQQCKSSPPNRFVYISTSGVYGDCKGQIVTEESPLAPLSERAKRRVYAEASLISFCNQYQCEYIILRVGGIYGAERLPIHRLKDITVIDPSEAPSSNRIHVSDLAKICHIAMNADIKNEIFNVSDGHSTTMTDYYFQIADLANQARPISIPLSEAEDKLSPAMLSFIKESRQLSTVKLNKLLKIQLQFPTLKLGLENCFKVLNATEM